MANERPPRTPPARRFAAIDVGTNAMRCHVAEVDEHSEPRILESIREPVRLGSHVFLTGRIGAKALDRTVEAFQLFKRLIENHRVEHLRAVATSAVREAADGELLRERIREATGIELEVIGGAEEAHLVKRAIGSRLDLGDRRAAAVDVGGGSVEVLVIDEGEVVRAESFNVGAVRLLEALPGPGDEGAGDFFTLLSEYVEAIRGRVRTALGDAPVDFVAATGGSVETLADLAGEWREGPPVRAGRCRFLPLDVLHAWTLKLSTSSYHERVERYGLKRDRADVIVPAAVVYLKIAEIFGAGGLYVPDVGLKDGLILDLVEEMKRTGALASRRREIRSVALGLGRRYALDEAHALKVSEIALALFDQLGELHGLGDEARTLLLTAALLHDVGLYVSASRHHKHSYYLISQSDLVGLSARQRDIVANVARYHRRRHPTTKHDHFEALSEDDRELVRRLAAILRAADVMDREHAQRVRSVRAHVKKNTVRLEVAADGDLLLERWAASRKFGLFEEVFGLSLEIEEERG